MSESTLKGAIAEAAITLAAVKLGFVVLRPLMEGRRYDLAIDTGPRLLRVQCKWARRKGEVVIVDTSTRRLTPQGYVQTTYDASEIDGVAAYCEALERCFYCRSTSLPADGYLIFVSRQLRIIKCWR